jgi:thymidylate synthase ThyX
LATAQFDYAANLRNLQTQAVQMQDAITSSVTGLQRISEEFVKSQAQFEQMRLAAANGAAAINNMIRSVLPNDMSVAWNFNIQVDNVMKEIIDPAKLEAHVQKEIRRYVDNACRGSNR